MAYVTLDDVREYAGYIAGDTADDAVIQSLIPRAERAIEKHTGNVFEVEAVSTRVFDWTDSYMLYFDQYLASTSDLVVTNGDGNTVASSNFITLPRNYRPIYGLELKLETDVVWEYTNSPQGAISIEGYWGYAQSPPDDIKLACIQLIVHWVRMQDQHDAKMMPDDIKLLLKPYKRMMPV